MCISNLSSNLIKCHPFCMCPNSSFHLLGHTNWSARHHLHSILMCFALIVPDPKAIEFRWYLRSIQLDITVKHQGPELMDFSRSRQRGKTTGMSDDIKYIQQMVQCLTCAKKLYICRNRWVMFHAFSLSPCFAWYHSPVISMISRIVVLRLSPLPSFPSFPSFPFPLLCLFLLTSNGSKAGLGWYLFSFHSRSCHLRPWCKPRIQNILTKSICFTHSYRSSKWILAAERCRVTQCERCEVYSTIFPICNCT